MTLARIFLASGFIGQWVLGSGRAQAIQIFGFEPVGLMKFAIYPFVMAEYWEIKIILCNLAYLDF